MGSRHNTKIYLLYWLQELGISRQVMINDVIFYALLYEKTLANLKLGLWKCIEICCKFFTGPFGIFFDPVNGTQVPYNKAIFIRIHINGYCTITYLAIVDFGVLIFPDFFMVAFAAARFSDLARDMVNAVSSN